MTDSLRRSSSQHYYLHHQRQRLASRCGMARSSSFRVQSLRTRVEVCQSCGQSHERGGNHLYDYPIEIDDDLMCQICLQPLVDPVDTPCSHTFCYSCIRSHLRRSRVCPTDREPLLDHNIRQSSILVRKILDKLTVVCPNTAYCDATMPRCSLERHLKHLCPGTYVHCPREPQGCQFVGPRNQLSEHLWTCNYGNDTDPLTGTKLEVIEDTPCLVEIPKGTSDLGLSVVQCERTGMLTIEDVFPGGTADIDNRLCIGDQIIEIDGQDFSYKSLAQARLALSTTKPLVAITVFRNSSDTHSPSQLEEVVLVKEEHRALGIQIQTLKHRSGIYVRHLVSGSVAEENGRIEVGDRILEANGVDVRHATIDETAILMAQITGSVRLQLAHRRRLSSNSDSSDLSISTSQLNKDRVYEELVARTGFAVGAGKCIILKKQPDENFGMSISGGIGSEAGDIPVFVSGIRADSVVDKSGTIQRGDLILSINGISLTDKTHSEAVQTIKSVTRTSVVRMDMIQGEEISGTSDDNSLSPDWERWIENYRSGRTSPTEVTITIQRSNNESLGFSVVGGVDSPKGHSHIFIKGIAPNSLTAIDGRLKSRDQLVRVNGMRVDGMTQREVVKLIKTSSGDLTLSVIPHHVTRV